VFIVGLVLATVVLVTGVTRLEAYIDPATPQQRQGLVQTLAQIAGGAALLVGLYFTRRTVQINQEGQITDRFTKAIDQLGAGEGNDKRLEVRLGGIYALGRIARDSEKDYEPIIEVLTAYAREHAPYPSEEHSLKYHSTVIASDIQAVLNVVGRRPLHWGKIEYRPIDLSGTDLRFANLGGMWLERADLHEANLGQADLPEAHLQGTKLYAAHLEGANLQEAHLEKANLSAAHLEGTDLRGVDLTVLAAPQLIEQEQMQRAIGDAKTRLPKGLRIPQWWEQGLPEDDYLVPRTYCTEVFKPSLSFSITENQPGWYHKSMYHQHHPGCVTIQDYSEIRSPSELKRLSFLSARGVFDQKNPTLDTFYPVPDDLVKWFRKHRCLHTEQVIDAPPIGGVCGTQFDTVVKSVPDQYPTVCDIPCLILLELGYGYKNYYAFLKGYKYRTIVLNVDGRWVTIIIESPADDFESFVLKATTVLDTVEWGK